MRFLVKSNVDHCIVESKNEKEPEHLLAIMQVAEPYNAWISCEKIPKGKRICKASLEEAK